MNPVVVPRDRLFIGSEQGAERAPFLLRRDDLVTHGVILGRTGSGKTGLGAVLVEELALSRVPVIVVDPKGDMTNLALSFPGLAAADLAPWVDPARNATDEAARWRRGIEESGQSAERVRVYREAAQVTVYAPGWVRSGDVPRVDVLPSLRPPRGLSPEGRGEQARGLVSAILGAAGVDADPTDPRHVFLCEVVLHRWSKGQDASIEGVVAAVQEPPFQAVGPMALDRFLPPNDRDKLARALVAYARSAGKWHGGTPLDMNLLLAPARDDGPVRVSVFTIAHLEAEERMFFVTLLLEALLAWMAEQPGSSRLRALLMIEEARGLLPPHPQSPASKAPLSRLLAQARAFGLGVVLSTQHPVDLDYKALSNVGTWFLGGLRERDLQRDLATELRDRGVDEGLLAQLEKRTFLAVTAEGKPRTLGVRWALSYLRGPIAPNELPELVRTMSPPPGASGAPPRTEPAPAPEPSRPQAVAAPTPPAPPVAVADERDARVVLNRRGPLPDDPWGRLTLPPRPASNKPAQLGSSVAVAHGPGPQKNGIWRPSLFGQVHLTFSRPRLPQVFEADVVLAVPLTPATQGVDWAQALHLDPARLRPGAPDGWQRFEEVPAPAVQAVFAFKAFQQVKRDLEAFARDAFVWTLTGGPPTTVGADAASREELRVRLGRALSDLTGAPLGADLRATALDWLLGAESPLAAAAGAARPDAAERWTPPGDLALRLERLVEALTASTRKPATETRADLLGPPAVRVDHLGLLWTASV